MKTWWFVYIPSALVVFVALGIMQPRDVDSFMTHSVSTVPYQISTSTLLLTYISEYRPSI